MAVYTKISQRDLQVLLAEYSIGKLQNFTAIAAGIQNSNYFIDTDSGRYVLTIYENRVNTDELPFFLGLMGHLAARGIPCPLPISAVSGSAISKISGKFCAIVSFVKGSEAVEITNSHVTELGINIANMHIAGGDFAMHRKNELSVDGWNNLFKSVKPRIDSFEPGLAEEISKNLEFLNANWPTKLPSGVVHGDVFPDNVLFGQDGKIAGIIDFYFACKDAYLYDLAICMNAWCFDKNHQLVPEKAKCLFDAYGSVRKISDAEFTVLPIIAAGAAMRFFLTRMYDWQNKVQDAIVMQKDPREYLQKLRYHFTVSKYSEYGL